MLVLRFPNFADRTADVRLDRIWLRRSATSGRAARRR
jgi:hypothetical protein